MAKGTIVVARPGIDEQQRNMIESAAKTAGYEVDFNNGDELTEEMLNAEIIYGEGPGVKESAAQSDKLRWLCASFSGVDAFCKPGAIKNEDALLSNSAGAFGVSLAEHAIMMALMIMRQMPVFYDGIKAREWLKPRPQASLKDARITLLGTGDIGSCLARRLKSFEPANITGVCRSGKCAEPAFDRVLKTEHLPEVLRGTDLLIISLPGTTETYHMINEEIFASMNPGLYLVNVGRGSVIDENALAEALLEKQIAGAALDVLESEPPRKDSPIWELPNLLLTPHVAGNLTVDYTRRRNTEMFCEDLPRFAKGEPLLHQVDRKRGY